MFFLKFTSGYTVRVFIDGEDYEFLGKMFGISGASGKNKHMINWYCYDTRNNLVGRHCCLFCTIKKDDLRVPVAERGVFPLRTLESLHADYIQFQSSGSDIRKAKYHNNVISTPFFNIPLNQAR